MVVHTYNLSTREAEAGGFQVGGQPGLPIENLSQQTTKILQLNTSNNFSFYTLKVKIIFINRK
jgi:hypothetical protein